MIEGAHATLSLPGCIIDTSRVTPGSDSSTKPFKIPAKMQTTMVQGNGECPKLPWMIEFHSTANGKILNNQLEAAYAVNFLEHLSTLNDRSKPKRKRLTQLAVVVPPKVSVDTLDAFLRAGMTVAVLRLDYFTVGELQEMIGLINDVNAEFGKKIGRVYPLAIALEVTDREIMTGKVLRPMTEIQLEKGQKTKVTGDKQFQNRVSGEYIYVNWDKISDVVKPGDNLILGPDKIRLSAYEIARDIINCIVDRAGILSDNLSVKIPNVPLIPETESNDKLIKIHEKCDVDIIFVGPGKIQAAKEIFGPTILVFVKVEHVSAVDVFDDVLKQVDGVLINGEKLIMTSRENVFILQKSIVAKCNKQSKPVMSSIDCHSVTKSIVNDIANTVIDGVDSLLLPPDPDLLEAICLVCKSAESAVYQRQLFDDLVHLKPPPIEPVISVAMAAVDTSFKSNAAAIILLTTSGRSGKLISMFRPRCPIIALTRFGRIAKQLMLYKGVIPIFYVLKSGVSFDENMERNMQLGMTFGKVNGYIRAGDAVVIVFGTKGNVGFRNSMEVVFASEYDTRPENEAVRPTL